MDRKKFGFTLVEILVVITVIGVLMAMAFVAYSGFRVSGRDNRRKADLANIASALEIYRADCGQYPVSITFGSALSGDQAQCSGNSYMAKVPVDPLNTGSSVYIYTSPAGNKTFSVCAVLERGGASYCVNNP